ncbi:hypothetical protein AB1Y20_014848 [Prymnesium parvum]|uniref:Uncharacterized protein n=1 Tax=Prymnesium parvum TaxID=97485 RepID=A0AB34K0R9_PRYPA
MKATVMQVQDEWTSEEVLCEMLKCEGLPLRSEFVVLKSAIHNGDAVALSQPGSGWPKTVQMSMPASHLMTLFSAREIHFEIQLSESIQRCMLVRIFAL